MDLVIWHISVQLQIKNGIDYKTAIITKYGAKKLFFHVVYSFSRVVEVKS
jgi:hypothetical protein